MSANEERMTELEEWRFCRPLGSYLFRQQLPNGVKSIRRIDDKEVNICISAKVIP